MDELSLKIERMPAFTRTVKRQQAHAREALATAQEIARHAEGATPTLAQSFIRGVNKLLKLSRYVTPLERSYYKTAHELERLQRARHGEHVPAPLALEVTVTGDADPPSVSCDQGATQTEALARDIEAESWEQGEPMPPA
jgi:hypothetical protein